jgi:hypothetical protein
MGKIKNGGDADEMMRLHEVGVYNRWDATRRPRMRPQKFCK